MQVPSDQNISFDEKPEMKCHEITDLAVEGPAEWQVPPRALQLPQPGHGRPYRQP